MLKNDFYRSKYDRCIYHKEFSSGCIMYLLLYVYDILIACKSLSEIQKLKLLLSGEFEMKDLGSVKKILGIDIRRDRTHKKLYLTQKNYLAKVLSKFGMKDTKLVLIPLASQFKLQESSGTKTEEEKAYMDRIPYANIVGSIMYAMVCTRPDLSYAVSLVSRFVSNLCKDHWHALKWILRYIKGTINKGRMFGEDKDLVSNKGVITRFVDYNFARCLDTRNSLTSYVFTTFGTTISWKASLQKVVALSSIEAEYMDLTQAIKEALWLLGLVREQRIDQDQIVVFCDNQGAVQLSKNQVFHERTKHIDIKLHFI